MPVGEIIAVYLWLDIDTFDTRIMFQCIYLDFIVKMADVANNGLIFHLFHQYLELMESVQYSVQNLGVNLVNEAWLNNTWSEVLALGAYALLILYFIKASMKVK